MCLEKVDKKRKQNEIIIGSGYQTHYTNRSLKGKQSIYAIVRIKCFNLFGQNQLKEIFDRFYSLKTHMLSSWQTRLQTRLQNVRF
jgi:hypothetical protein